MSGGDNTVAFGGKMDLPMTSDDYLDERQRLARWCVDHVGVIAGVLSAIAVTIGFLTFVFTAGSVNRFGIGADEVPRDSNLYLVLFYFFAAMALLPSNYYTYNLHYSGRRRCAKVGRHAICVLVCLVVALIGVAAVTVVEADLHGASISIDECLASASQFAYVTVLVALLLYLCACLPGTVFAWANGKKPDSQGGPSACESGSSGSESLASSEEAEEAEEAEATEEAEGAEAESASAGKPETFGKRLGREVIAYAAVVAVVTIMVYIMGSVFATSHLGSVEVINMSDDETSAEYIVLKTSDSYCVEQCRLEGGKVVVDASSHKWLSRDGVEVFERQGVVLFE